MEKQEFKNVAGYIRVSSDEQAKEGYSPQTQQEKIKDFVKKNGYRLDKRHIYIDLGRSGGTENRPELQRLLANARNKEFDAVIVYRMDRFFRNLRLLLNTVDELRNIGIGFVSVSEPFDTSTPTGRAMFANAGVFAEWMREIGLESRNEGMIKAMRAGKYLSGTSPYGYDRDEKTRRLKRNRKEGAVIKMIFNWLVSEELSEHKIQQRLNGMNIPTKFDHLGRTKLKNKKNWWSKRTIGRILRNEIYSGTFYYRKFISSNRIGQVNNLRPKEDWVEMKTPAIISEELFERAQKQLDKNRDFSPRRTLVKYVFQHKIICGYDGRRWQSACRGEKGGWKAVKYYFCPGTRPSITPVKCPSSSLSESKIAPVVWKSLVGLLKHPEATMKALEQYKDQKSKEAATEKQFNDILGLLKTNKGQQDRLNKAFIYDGIDERKYKENLEKIKREESYLLSEKQRFSQDIISEEEKDKRTESVKELYEKIKTKLDSADYDLKHLIIQRLVNNIIIKGEDMSIEFGLPTREYLPCLNLRDSSRMDRNL